MTITLTPYLTLDHLASPPPGRFTFRQGFAPQILSVDTQTPPVLILSAGFSGQLAPGNYSPGTLNLERKVHYYPPNLPSGLAQVAIDLVEIGGDIDEADRVATKPGMRVGSAPLWGFNDPAVKVRNQDFPIFLSAFQVPADNHYCLRGSIEPSPGKILPAGYFAFTAASMSLTNIRTDLPDPIPDANVDPLIEALAAALNIDVEMLRQILLSLTPNP